MSDRRVHLWPAPGATVPGVPPVEYTVTPAVADLLTAYQPPAFLRSRPDGWDTTPAGDEELLALDRFLADAAPETAQPDDPVSPEEPA